MVTLYDFLTHLKLEMLVINSSQHLVTHYTENYNILHFPTTTAVLNYFILKVLQGILSSEVAYFQLYCLVLACSLLRDRVN